MDPNSNGISEFINDFKGVYDETLFPYSNLNLQNGFNSSIPSPDVNYMNDIRFPESNPFVASNFSADGISSGLSHGWSPGGEVSSPSDDSDSSDPVLKYISQMLLEENMDEQPCMFYNPLVLQATEKSLYDAITHQFDGNSINTTPVTSTASTVDSDLQTPVLGDYGLMGSSVNALLLKNMFSDKDSILQFKRGLEEGNKFLPSENRLVIDSKRLDSPGDSSGRRKNHKRVDENRDLEDVRSNKQSAIDMGESAELSEMFDKVLLLNIDSKGKPLECAGNGPGEVAPQNGQSSGSHSSGNRSRARKGKKDNGVVDLRTLLILCAQAVSSNDFRTASELLKQIREHASDSGDGSQRLAYFFANGLEARLAGTQSGAKNFFCSLFPKTTAADILKAYKIFLSACPFKKFAILFANKMIMHVSEGAKTLHVIDFGVMYGFQWPILIQLLSMRHGGPPKLKITGIEIPEPGFRPSQRNEETGRRIAKYCERFNVPFEYNGVVSQHWEKIRIEELKVDSSEVVAVNCLFRFKNLLDETTEVDCPRDTVLKLIRKINPAIFVHSIVNGSYNAPFFVTRFREAIFHFSSLYDMFDATLPRDEQERTMLEREFYGREAMNVVACEGSERVERPETYKQWQVRCVRAGFKLIPLERELMKKFGVKLKAWYDKDFVIDEDGHWMLQGWKGRILYSSSCWVPA